MPPATADAGRVRRPVLSVMSASLSPLPSPQSTFSTGTFTLVKRMMPFSMALRPMKWSRCTTSTPGQLVSTMNAVIFFGPGPCHHHHQLGDRAVGAPELLAIEHVVRPVGRESTADVLIAAGSEPTFDSVSAKALTAPLARRGRYFFFCSGGAEDLERLGHADRLRGGEERGEVAVHARHHADRVGVGRLAQAEAAVLLGDLDAERADAPGVRRSPRPESFPRDRSGRCPPSPEGIARAAP